MSALDELIEDIVDGHSEGFFLKAEVIADHLIARGYRRSVTPDQIAAAAKAIHDDCDIWPPVDSESDWTAEARAAARAFGLEVNE